MLRRALAVLAVTVAGAVAASPALAAKPNPMNPAGKKEYGVVPAKSQAGRYRFSGGNNLRYWGGPVMHTNRVYAIYWVPPGYSVDSGYESVINRYFTDVAAASGTTSNVYDSDTQYYDGSGYISYASTFAGSAVDTNPLPANGCADSYTSACVSDAQIQSEISRVIAANGWTANSSTEFFMFTAKGIGSCYQSGSCSFSQYCAYHSNISNSSVIYANMPYADTVPSACDSGQHPNNDDADATLNVTSHEHNESITDPLGTAWYDSQGYEDGDKCAWTFGTALGSTAYGQYNQLINGDHYYLQREWSNHSSGCVLTGI